MRINVRFAEPKDLDFCVKSDFKHLTEAIVKRKIEEKAVILAEVDGILVGYLRLEYFWYAIPYLGNIGVNKRHRRKGVGTAMIKFLSIRTIIEIALAILAITTTLFAAGILKF